MITSPSAGAAGLIAAMSIAEMLTMVGAFAFPALQPDFASQWHLSSTAAGWINGVYFGTYALSVPVLASLTDRVDGRNIYVLGGVIMALSWAGFALFADGMWSALVFRGLAGFGLAGTFLPGMKALLDRLPGSAHSRAIAFYTATFSLGTSVSFLASGWLARSYGWRVVFAVAAAACALAVLIALWSLRHPRRVTAAPDRHVLDFRPVLRNRASMGYMLAYMTHVWELFAFRSWIVTFLSFSVLMNNADPELWSPTTVAALTGLVAMGASIAGEELAQRYGRVRTLTAIMLASAAVGACLGFTAAWSYPVVAGLCVVYAVLVQADSAALHAGAITNADPTRRGATMALQSLMGFAAAFFAPLAIGVVLDMTGGGRTVLSWGMGFLAMALIVATGPWFLRRFSATPNARAAPQ